MLFRSSGKGSSPLGPLEGSWVLGFFLDGEDMQQPAMLGCIASTTVANGFSESPDTEFNSNPNDGTLKDKDGNTTLDENGAPVKAGTPDIPGWKLGQTSEKYEVGQGGPGTINDYLNTAAGDFGGASYGIYQMYSGLPLTSPKLNRPRDGSGGTVKAYVNSQECKIKNKFAGLTPGTTQFDKAWKDCAKDSAAFRDDQHAFIERTIYEKAKTSLKRLQYLDVDNYGPAVKDLLWSTAVQWGPGRADLAFRICANKSTLTDKEVVDLASTIASRNGGSIEVLHDARVAAKEASVLYTDVWMSMGDPESERREKEKALAPFAVTDELMHLASKDAIFMHCLPAHRGEEVAASVIDGPRSVIWREAFHRRDRKSTRLNSSH